MQLSYRNPNFWEEFRTRYWEPRIPTVIRQPFKEFPFSEALVLQAMKDVEAGLQAGDKRKDVMVSVGDKMKDPKAPLRKLFKPESESLDDLEEQAGRVFKKQNFGLIVTNCHTMTPGVWSGVAGFLQDARNCIDFPVPRAFMDLFYGRYLSSFTGLHKDTQDIFAFVFRGEKRMLAWPFEYLAERLDEIEFGDKYANKRLDHIDHRKYRKDAVVLDGKAGDLIYWPGDHWHVAEPKNKKFSGMMSLGVLRPEFKFESTDTKFREKLLRPNTNPGQKELAALVSQDMTDVVIADVAEQKLRWISGFGFEHGGHVAEAMTAPKGTLTVVKSKSSVVFWHRDEAQNQLLVVSGGQSLRLPYSKDALGLLEQVSRGESVSVTKDPKRASKDSQILESFWSKQLKPKVRKVSGRDSLAYLVQWLIRVGAANPS